METDNISFGSLTLKTLINSAPGYMYWKDLNSIYRGCNQKLADLCGFDSPEEIIGKTDDDFIWRGDLAREFCKDDQIVLASGKVHVSHCVIPCLSANGFVVDMIVKTEKSPLVNDQGKPIGIVGVAMDVSNDLSAVLKLFDTNFIDKVDFLNDSAKLKITKREYEVLYLLYLGKSPKEIAWILGGVGNKQVAPATIRAVINKRLYLKFKVNSCGQLIEEVIKANLLHYIPHGFIDQKAAS